MNTLLFWSTIGQAFLETFQMAFLGTVAGVCIAFPFTFLSSKRIVGNLVSRICLFIFAAFRAFPALLWALFFVIVVGLGPLAGILAIMMNTIGYFGKLVSDDLESIDPKATHALKATGANTFQLMRFVYFPLVLPKIFSTLLFLFEYNIRHSTLLGIVGAGGIGFYLMGYIKWLEYEKALVVIGLILLVVLVLELISSTIRKYVNS
jgi:phosphonate transport system permease protein